MVDTNGMFGFWELDVRVECWEYALEAIMYDVIPNVFIKIIKLSIFEHLICIIEYVIWLWNYVSMMFLLYCT